MIRFIPEDTKGTYLRLLSPRSNAEALDALLSTIEDSNIKTKIGSRSLEKKPFKTGYIYLPNPLDYIDGLIWSDGQSYDGHIALRLKGNFNECGAILPALLEQVIKKISSEDKETASIDKSLLFVYDKEPYFIFSKGVINSEMDISFGSSGTSKRKLTTLDQFEADFNKLAEITTKVVNACYTQETPDINFRLYFE